MSLDRLFYFFRVAFAKTAGASRPVDKLVIRRIVSRVGREHVHLSAGRYLTGADIEKLRRKAFSERFSCANKEVSN